MGAASIWRSTSGAASASPRTATAGPARRKANAKLQKDIRKLEQDLSVDQQGTVLERATRNVLGNPFVKRVLDIVSRPNYAVAGVYEEIAADHGFISAGKRLGRELFSGIGGIKGEKQGFGEAFEDLGYGPGGSLSGAAPFAFSETGEGVRFRRGGFFDFTARGSLGTALDIVADPTTYLTLGTGATAKSAVKAGGHYLSNAGVRSLRSSFADGLRKGLTQAQAETTARQLVGDAIDKGAKHLADQGGIKLFGKTLVPGEVMAKPARSVADGITKFLHKSSLGEGVISVGEGIGRVLDRDFRVRNRPEFKARKQLWMTTITDEQRKLREMVENLYRGTNAKQRQAITNWIDSGGSFALPPRLAALAKQNLDVTGNFAKLEQDLGLLERVRLNYVLHAYKESPKRVDQILARADLPSLSATLRGSQKARTIPTLAEARSLGLTPIEDAAELLLRRGLRHIHAVETHRFFTDVANRWGVRALDDELEVGAAGVLNELNDVAKALEGDAALNAGKAATTGQATTGITPAEMQAVKTASRRGVPLDEVRKFSDEGKREFLRRKFEVAENPIHLERTVNKYREFEHLFPDTTSQAARRLKSFNGEPMATIDLPQFKGMTLPVDIAEDLRDFNKSFIDKKEVEGLLYAYDKFMNSFKVGVTSIFPSFHFRNAYSNIVQQFTDVGLSALNPAIHFDAVRMLGGDVNGSFLARHGRRWGYGEVVYEAKRRGVIADYRNIFETFGDKIPIRTGTSKTAAYILHPVDTWKRFGGIIENESRLTLFTNYLRRGLDPETAAQRVNKVLFDYKNLSKVERDVLARMFPFYRWTRKNIQLQAERLFRNPGQAATQAKLTRQNRTDPTLLPKYLRGDFVFTLEADPKTGQLQYIRGLDLPISDLNVMSEPLQLVIGNLSPAIKLIPELVMDRDFFRDRRISETSTPLLKAVGASLDLLPARAKKAIEFSKRPTKAGIEYRMNQTLTYIMIKSWALSRVYGTAERMMRSKSLFSQENFLDVNTGFRLQDVDVDVQAQSLEFEYKDFLERKATAAGIRKKFEVTFKPKQKK